MFCEPAIEALDQAVCLGPEGPDEPMADPSCGAQAVERMVARRFAWGLALLVDSKAIGPFPAIVGEHGVNRMREVCQEALEEGAGCSARALVDDFDIYRSGCSVDGDEGIGTLAPQSGQILDIEVNEAAWRGFEGLRLLTRHS